MYRSLNDTVVASKNIGRDCFYFDGLDSTNSQNGFIEAIDYTQNLTTYLKNSTINAPTMINNTGAIRNRNYYFTNNKFTCTEIYNNWSGDSSNKLYLLNCQIATSAIVSNANCTLYYDGNYSASSGLIKGITGFSSYTLGSMPVGTVLFSNTPTKSIVRKTSEGSSSSNWEEI